MKKIVLIFSFILVSHSVNASVLLPKIGNSSTHNKMQDILSNIFFEEIFKRTKNLKLEEEFGKKSKTSVNDGRRGKMIIEQMKQRNREKLAKMRGFDPAKVKTGNDLVKLQIEDNKAVLKKMKEAQEAAAWKRLAKSEMDALKKRVLETHREWRKKHSKTLGEWKKEKGKFGNKIGNYKNMVFDIPLILPVSKKDLNKKVEVKIPKEFSFVSSSLDLPVRDQRKRPTCSSFSGIRAIEVLLNQNKKKANLSEQYFYWASKPKCRQTPCRQRGSWVGYGLAYSRDSKAKDIPTEESCPYVNSTIRGNETQVPLKNSCSNGKVKVRNFSYVKNLDGVLSSLRKNKPVIASLSLSPNFYKNKGLVLYKESLKNGKMDSHAEGHSVLLVGYLKLPRILNEGSVCFVTANSWGIGWGHGGYACLSEKWVLKYRKQNPFVTVDSLLF